HRPAWPQSDSTPDWPLAGDIGIPHAELDLDSPHPIGRITLNGTVTTNDPADWIREQAAALRTEESIWTVANFTVECSVGNDAVTVTATGPADRADIVKQQLREVEW